MRSIDNYTTIVLVLSCIKMRCGKRTMHVVLRTLWCLISRKAMRIMLVTRWSWRVTNCIITSYCTLAPQVGQSPPTTTKKLLLGAWPGGRPFKTLAWLEITRINRCVLSRILVSGKNSKYPSPQDTAMTSDLGLICYYDLVIDSTLKRIVSPVIYWFRYRLNVSLFSLGLMHGSGWLKISSQLLLCAWEVV